MDCDCRCRGPIGVAAARFVWHELAFGTLARQTTIRIRARCLSRSDRSLITNEELLKDHLRRNLGSHREGVVWCILRRAAETRHSNSGQFVPYLDFFRDHAKTIGMKEVHNENFGLIIAYLIPGGVSLVGISQVSTTVSSWLGASSATSPTVMGFLFATLASIGLGVCLNLFRYLTIDNFHQWMGIRKGRRDYSSLQEHVAAIDFVVQNQFRYHQFYGNVLIAMALNHCLAWKLELVSPAMAACLVLGEGVLFIGSRICFRNYCARLDEILRKPKSASPVLWVSPYEARR